MKRSKFSEAQIAFILRQGEEGTAVGEICGKAGISEATYYNWRKKYGGLMPSEMKRYSCLRSPRTSLSSSSNSRPRNRIERATNLSHRGLHRNGIGSKRTDDTLS